MSVTETQTCPSMELQPERDWGTTEKNLSESAILDLNLNWNHLLAVTQDAKRTLRRHQNLPGE